MTRDSKENTNKTKNNWRPKFFGPNKLISANKPNQLPSYIFF